MPKEQINYPSESWHQNEGSPAVMDSPAEPALHVVWNGANDPHVQLGMTAHFTQFAAVSGTGDNGYGHLYTPVLSRAELNKLIRTLRRARDAAYGRDE